MMKYDCLIIGGGVSGMTSAIIMAKNGYRTAIIEKSHTIGPTIRGFVRDGIFFDSGFHYTGGLNEGEPFNIFLRYLRLSDRIETEPFMEDGFDAFQCLKPDFEFLFPYGHDRIRDRFLRSFPNDAGAIDTFFNAVSKIYHSQPYINLDVELDSPGLQSMHRPSLKEFLDGITDNEMLKCVLSMHCLLYGVSPDEVPFSHHAFVAGSYYESVNGIKGGGASLVGAFGTRLKDFGVDVLCGKEVTEIMVNDDNSISSVRCGDDSVVLCRSCISTIHPQAILQIAPHASFRPVYRKRLQLLEDTCSAFIVYARSSVPIKILDRTNLFLFPDTRFNFQQNVFSVEEKPIFVTHAKSTDESAEGAGCIMISPTPNLGAECWTSSCQINSLDGYIALKDFISDKIIAHVETSYPDLQGNLTRVDCATPLTLRNFTNSPLGSLYGLKHSINQYNPAPLTKIKNFVLAGQSIIAPGIYGAAVSSFLACGSILGHGTLIKKLRQCT
jgi:all-trans-retinol 13,14-reductase